MCVHLFTGRLLKEKRRADTGKTTAYWDPTPNPLSFFLLSQGAFFYWHACLFAPVSVIIRNQLGDKRPQAYMLSCKIKAPSECIPLPSASELRDVSIA